LWSTDIYSKYLNTKANDQEKIKAGQKAILFSLGTSLIMGLILLYLKFDDPDSAFTHTLNNLRYYINCGIVVLICSAVILSKPRREIVLFAFIATLPINLSLQIFFPEMNYFIRAFWVIFIGLFITIAGSRGKLNSLLSLFKPANSFIRNCGWALAISLILLHVIFH
jgi:SSS family solute:Na+ symporter